jgi:hypothetical protein
MTAEIAILNRSAVALAADSAMTLKGADAKSYDSAEKIFQLSRFQPIGLMIYNNSIFLNMPLEVSIRRFRRPLTSNHFASLFDVWPEFEQFLLNKTEAEEADRLDHFHTLLTTELVRLRNMVYDRDAHRFVRGERRADPQKFLMKKIAERTTEAKADPHWDGFLADVTLEAFVLEYGPVINAFVGVELGPPVTIDDKVRGAINEMMFALVRSNHRSDFYTGFVIAGFGAKDMFPALFAVEWDGLYFGKSRLFRPTKPIEIDRRDKTAAIEPFAQKDMPERFIAGIDKKFENDLDKAVDRIVGDVIAGAGKSMPKKKAMAIKNKALADFRGEINKTKQKARDNVESVATHMSKKELGELAYSLVEITVRKRRYSNERETVGGPIDLAIITLNEGFVWVRRKHYFDQALNPQYPAR